VINPVIKNLIQNRQIETPGELSQVSSFSKKDEEKRRNWQPHTFEGRVVLDHAG
jgi:hypothetical protein